MKKTMWLVVVAALLLVAVGGQALGEGNESCPHARWIDITPTQIEETWEPMVMSHNHIYTYPKRCLDCGAEATFTYSVVEGHEMKMESWEHLMETEEDIYRFICIRCGFTDERIVPCEGKEDECGMMYKDASEESDAVEIEAVPGVQDELLQQTTSDDEVVFCPHEWEGIPGNMEVVWMNRGTTHEMMLLSPMRCVLCGEEAYDRYVIEEEHTYVRMYMDFVVNGERVGEFICTRCGNFDIQTIPSGEAER